MVSVGSVDDVHGARVARRGPDEPGGGVESDVIHEDGRGPAGKRELAHRVIRPGGRDGPRRQDERGQGRQGGKQRADGS